MKKEKSVKELYEVRPIPFEYARDWCLKRHYARRVPQILQAYGLYNTQSGMLVGCCTFGLPPNYNEVEAWKPFELWELNRLIVQEGLPRNTTSFFVSQCLKRIEKPKVIISYADLEWGHYGYIYQATNWVFTGISGKGQNVYITKNGREVHQRHVSPERRERMFEKGVFVGVKKTKGKARYYYFCADKKTKQQMLQMLRFPILPYPKGDPKRYDSNPKKTSQFQFF